MLKCGGTTREILFFILIYELDGNLCIFFVFN